MNIWTLLTIGAYLAFMVVVGAYFSKKSSNASE